MDSSRYARIALLSVAVVAVPGAAAAADRAGQAPPPTALASWRFDDRPSLRIGDVARVDFRAKLQADLRAFEPEPDDKPADHEVTLGRVAVEGWLFRVVEYEVSYDLQDEEEPWRDVYANLRVVNAWQVQGGRFKVPFGRERLTAPTRLDFVERTLVSRNLTPGRSTGAMVHGRLARRKFGYAVGLFEGETEPGDADDLVDEATSPRRPGMGWAGRATLRPFQLTSYDGWAEQLEVGVALGGSRLPEGLHGLDGKAQFGQAFFPEVYVNGQRGRLGLDGALVSGPMSVQAEYVRVRDQRRAQGIGNDTLPDLVAQGYWVAGTVVLTGEPKADVEHPRRPFLAGGLGAFELATRIEKLWFRSATTAGDPPFRNPRAANVLPNGDTVWTGGVNWYVNRFVKVQGNAVHERFDDIERALAVGDRSYWTFVLRVQFAM